MHTINEVPIYVPHFLCPVYYKQLYFEDYKCYQLHLSNSTQKMYIRIYIIPYVAKLYKIIIRMASYLCIYAATYICTLLHIITYIIFVLYKTVHNTYAVVKAEL